MKKPACAAEAGAVVAAIAAKARGGFPPFLVPYAAAKAAMDGAAVTLAYELARFNIEMPHPAVTN
jgi:NAD(P)-dependent dehydrogenase (short-subunit alcohol dehydrogenase family)